MSCNGCRALRKACSDDCVLRSCLQWIESPEAQGHATIFLAKFFGRAVLLDFISNVPESQRATLIKSMLLESCGRKINPVSGAVGLFCTGNWSLCQTAVDTLLRGGTPRVLTEIPLVQLSLIPEREACDLDLCLLSQSDGVSGYNQARPPAVTPSMTTEESVTTSAESGGEQPTLLNLFV